jgi:squalene-hopene/tetraprenyl-beta-curcumene cyclase
MRSPESIRKPHEEVIARGYTYLLRYVRPDGGIYPDYDPKLESYNTSIAIMAMVAADAPNFEETIINARKYLLTLQADEDDGISPDSSTYGGIGYNKDERSDISNMQFALEALRASQDFREPSDAVDPVKMDDRDSTAHPQPPNEDLFWDKAITFLQRSQNLKAYNDYTWSSNDGGFVYYPGVSKAGATTSYGGMTYAGMKSLIHAGLAKSDERVQAAFRWICANYTVEENPELGQQGLFYYYHVMAKALAIYGEHSITDTSGGVHDWRGDLAGKLLEIQKPDGSWINENGRWWENNPDLVTAYCVIALVTMLESDQQEK